MMSGGGGGEHPWGGEGAEVRTEAEAYGGQIPASAGPQSENLPPQSQVSVPEMTKNVTNLRDELAQHGCVQQIVLRLLKSAPTSRQGLGQLLLKLKHLLPPLGPLSTFSTATLCPQNSGSPTHRLAPVGSPWAGPQGTPVPRARGSGSDPHQLPRDVQVEGTSLLQQQEGRVEEVLGEAHGCHGTSGPHMSGQHKVGGFHGQDDGLTQEKENGLWGGWAAKGREAVASVG